MNAMPPFSSIADRALPVNPTLEQELLGALIMRPDTLAAVRPILSPEHFGEPLHAMVYESVLAAADAGQTPSIGAIRQFIGERDFTTNLGGLTPPEYLPRMMAEAYGSGELSATAR